MFSLTCFSLYLVIYVIVNVLKVYVLGDIVYVGLLIATDYQWC
jgi:hypothetical protein